MTDITHILETLHEVNRLLPPGHDLDSEILQRIRMGLETHMSLSADRRPEGYEIEDVSIDIEFMFEELSSNDFNEYPLRIEDITVRKFLKDEGFGRNENRSSNGTNPASRSVRLIAAFLVLSNAHSLTLDDLISDNLSNVIAKKFANFIGFIDAEDGLLLEQVKGVYTTEWNSGGGEIDSIQLILEISSDGSHLLVEEKYLSRLKTSQNLVSTKAAYGWCILTSSDVLLIILKNPKTKYSSLYSSLHVQLDKDASPTMDKVIFQRHDKHFGKVFDSDKAFSEPKFDEFIKERQLVFSKVTAEILTFEKPFDAKTRKSGLSKMYGMDDTRSSAVNVVSIRKKDEFMDEEERKKISKEMLNCIIDVADRDEERFFELLDMGASINYCDPRLNATVMHAVGQYYPEFFEEVLKRSHEKYDFLIRDNDGRLASGWAFDTYPQNPLYKLMREYEIEFGRQKGIFPDPLRNRPWDETFPNGYFPKQSPPNLDM